MMVEFKGCEPEVVKPGEYIKFPRESMVLHGKTFYPVFHNLAWLRYKYEVNVKIVRHYYQNICTCPMYKNVAVASIEMGRGWNILYNKLREIGQIGVFDDNDPVESVHVEFSSDESVEVVICLAPKEEK